MNINTNKLSLSHCTFEIPQPLDREKTIFVMVEAQITDVSYPSEENGTYNQVFRAKHVGACEVKQGEEVIKGKSKKSISQRMHSRAFVYAEEQGIDFEKHYEEMGNKIIRYYDLVVEMLQSKS